MPGNYLPTMGGSTGDSSIPGRTTLDRRCNSLPRGVLYMIGVLIYARKKARPIPDHMGYHEIFHLFVILVSVAFVAYVWVWALPFARV